jgi:hypothetical protein
MKSRGALQGQRLGHQLTQNHVQTSDKAESDDNRNAMRVNRGVRKVAYRPHHHFGKQRLAHPPQREAYNRDSKLDAIDHFVEVAVQLLDDTGTDATSLDELLDARVPNAHQGEFRGCEESVGCDQEQDQKHPEQHEGDHGYLILTFQRKYYSVGR